MMRGIPSIWTRTRGALSVSFLTALFVATPAVRAARIGDVTHLQGRRINKLVGLGLVTGLKGTGDGSDFRPAINALGSFLGQFSNPVVDLEDVRDAKNVAIVTLEVVLPDNGVREGDRLDVQVTSLGAAKSLVGGRLIIAPLQPPAKDASTNLALGSGAIRVFDPKTPTVGVIPQGAVMEEDIIHNYIALGSELPYSDPWLEPLGEYVTLVVDDAQASWAMAYTIAQIVNEDASEPGRLNVIAKGMDPKNVIVRLSDYERADPAAFISRLEMLDLFAPRGEARVQVNRNTQTIAVSGDVEILPVVVSYKDLTIDTTLLGSPLPEGGEGPAGNVPLGSQNERSHWITMDPQRQGKTRLAELVQSLEQLRVPAEDQINIIVELHRMGKLLGQLRVEE